MDSSNLLLKKIRKGRGALDNPQNLYEKEKLEAFDDGWASIEEIATDTVQTKLFKDNSKKVINYIRSPDIPLDRSINPYRGCEHGCVYCFARPTHNYLGFSAGLDFETKIVCKFDAHNILKKELKAKNYQCLPIILGSNTDPYQPIEKKLQITRKILKVLLSFQHPVSIITKSALIERDLDILQPMAEKGLVQTMISVTTLKNNLSTKIEPRTSIPKKRLQIISNLSKNKVPVGVLAAPMIPFINDHELESILTECRRLGALGSGYVLIRLPHQLKQIFESFLKEHFPQEAKRIMNRIYDSRGGKAYDSKYGERMRGVGIYANLLAQRFNIIYKKLQFPGFKKLNCSSFIGNIKEDSQIKLF